MYISARLGCRPWVQVNALRESALHKPTIISSVFVNAFKKIKSSAEAQWRSGLQRTQLKDSKHLGTDWYRLAKR